MNIGFIGCGNMAGAIIRGILSGKTVNKDQIMASAKSEATQKKIREEMGLLQGSNAQVAAFSDVLFLAVKPIFYEGVLEEIKGSLRDDTLVISMAAGKSLSWLEEKLGQTKNGAAHPVIRIMPNTPAMVQAGITGMCANAAASDENRRTAEILCRGFGIVEWVEERLMDVVTAVSGSSPAYIYMIIEAMADGAVSEGMPRAQAYRFAAQAVLGSAKMVLESGLHPGVLKDQVCSPGGTTIEAVRVLEERGLRSALIEAEKACAAKSREL